MPHHRLTPTFIYTLRSQLSSRDLAIIQTLSTVRLATTRHIQALHFTPDVPLSKARVCYRTLERLDQLSVICHLSRRVEPKRSGSAGYVYQLDRAGLILAEVKKRRIIRPHDYHYAVIDHTLAVTDLYARLHLAHKTSAVQLITFGIESKAWRGQLRPDAFVELIAGNYRYFWFIEMDMDTQRPNKIQQKLAAYARYRGSGAEQQANGVFPKVLFLVPNENRKQQIQALIDKQPGVDRRLFQVELQTNAYQVMKGEPSL